MRAFVKNYLDAMNRRREENGENGFSLIELIVVVVILGILVAVAIPIFLNVQQTAKDNSLKSAAANGATVVASQIAKGSETDIGSALTKSSNTDYTLSLAEPAAAADATIDSFCVKAEATSAGALKGGTTAYSGPSCSSATAP